MPDSNAIRDESPRKLDFSSTIIDVRRIPHSLGPERISAASHTCTGHPVALPPLSLDESLQKPDFRSSVIWRRRKMYSFVDEIRASGSGCQR